MQLFDLRTVPGLTRSL